MKLFFRKAAAVESSASAGQPNSKLPTLNSRRASRAACAAGFTLVELLVVVAIIGILASLLGAAIMNANKTANKKRTDNNAKMLEAAIIEYWHDNGQWPVAGSVIKEKLSDASVARTRSRSKVVGSDVASGKLNYKMTFYEDNDLVVKHLLDKKLANGSRKTYLNLKGFVTPVQTDLKRSDYPTQDTVDAYLAFIGEAVSDSIDSDERTVTRKEPVLLFRTEMFRCPDCGTLTKEKHCPNISDSWATEHGENGNKECPFHANNGYKRPLRSRDRAFGAKPFTIEFDLNDNTVSVKAE